MSHLIRMVLLLVGLLPVLLTGHMSRAASVKIQILQTTDIHGFVESSDELEKGGGWLRIASLVRDARKNRPDNSTLLIDCGDTCQGTLIATLSRGQVAIEMLKALDYDVWVPGNHELDFGARRCAEFCSSLDNRVLCGNLEFSLDGQKQVLPAWRIFTRREARIAVIGLTASFLKQWLWGKTMEGYTVCTGVDTLIRIIPEVLNQNPDMIVLATHQGWLEYNDRGVNEIYEIMQKFPEIDLILGGHTHVIRQGIRLGEKTWYVQAGKHAGHLGIVDAVIDIDHHKVLDISSRLIPAGPEIPQDPECLKKIKHWRDLTKKMKSIRVGSLARSLSAKGKPGEDCDISEMLCRAIAAGAHAKIVFHGTLSGYTLYKGTVTEEDLFRVVPYENSVALASLTLEELTTIIQEQLTRENSYVYNGPWGVNITIDKDKKVTDIRVPNGSAGTNKSRFKVAFNSYAVAGGGGRFPKMREILRRPSSRLVDTEINSRDAVRKFLRKNPRLNLTAKRWLIRE